MKFEINDIITIDEEDFFVASQTERQNINYVFLIKTNDNEDLLEEFDIVALNDDNTLSEVVDNEIYAELYEEFIGKMKK